VEQVGEFHFVDVGLMFWDWRGSGADCGAAEGGNVTKGKIDFAEPAEAVSGCPVASGGEFGGVVGGSDHFLLPFFVAVADGVQGCFSGGGGFHFVDVVLVF
jgi:hypothetical protein